MRNCIHSTNGKMLHALIMLAGECLWPVEYSARLYDGSCHSLNLHLDDSDLQAFAELACERIPLLQRRLLTCHGVPSPSFLLC